MGSEVDDVAGFHVRQDFRPTEFVVYEFDGIGNGLSEVGDFFTCEGKSCEVIAFVVYSEAIFPFLKGSCEDLGLLVRVGVEVGEADGGNVVDEVALD
jgi:hypothetical protein